MIAEATLLLRGAALALSARQGLGAGEAKEKAVVTAARDAQELALRLLGSVLFEMRSNLERIRLIEEYRQKNGITFAPFDFTVSDALMPELCRAAPTPAVLDRCRLVIAACKRVDFYQRIAASAPGAFNAQGLPSDGRFVMAGAYAHDALSTGKDVVSLFNSLVRVGREAGRQLYGEDAWTDENGLFPAQIDPAAAIDHSVL